MDRRPSRNHCKFHILWQTLRSRLCTTLSLPTVNAATLYKRITPEQTSEESEEEIFRNDSETKLQTEIELNQSETETGVESGSLLNEEIQKIVAQDADLTGWERIRQVYYVEDRYSDYITAELADLTMMLITSFALGFLYGGMPASHVGRKRYIERSQGAVYQTKFYAASDSYNAGARGLIRYGFRWGWRVAFVATSFQLLSSCLSLYRNKVDMWNYGIAAFSTGAMYRYNLGLRGMIGGGVGGLLVGVPAGISLLVIQRMAGESSLERSQRHRAEYMIRSRQQLDAAIVETTDELEQLSTWLKEKERTASDETQR